MILLIPFVVLPLLLLILGVTWGLASLGVFLRDVSQFIGMVVTAFLFMSPIFYPITALPEKYRVILRLNPLSPALEQTRDVLFWNKMPDIRIWILYLMLSAIVSWLGFYFFQKTRKGFADVL
jgi:lipopolysaccharide transport system permease protein